MIVGLRDSTFAHDICSTAWKTPRHITYTRDPEAETKVTLFTDGHLYSDVVDECQSPIKLGWLHEPPGLIPNLYLNAPSIVNRFDSVLTYHPDLLKLPGCEFMPYGGVWLDEDDWGMHLKTALVSMLYGVKDKTEGQRLRPVVADAIAPLGIDFYGARGKQTDYSIQTKLTVHKHYAFSVVIEADRLDNLFTEILLDCLAVGTIPILWGCPNVGKYFDQRGILSFSTVDECITLVKSVSYSYYLHLMKYARDNLEAAREYAVAEDWLYTHILKRYDHSAIPA